MILTKIDDWVWFYYNHGFSIVPLKENDKIPNIGKWKQFQKRRPTKSEIQSWLDNGLFKNIGVICGNVSNKLVVLDLDDENIVSDLGLDFDKIIQKGCWVTKTGGEGRYHIWLKNNKETGDTKKDSKVNLEYRANGCYVVAPPSIHPNGNQYQFLNNKIENYTKLKETDAQFYYNSMVKELRKKRRLLNWTNQRLDIDDLKNGVKKGSRNNSSFLLACHYRDTGLSEEEVKLELNEWNKKNKPPLDIKELNRTIESALSYPPRFRIKESSLMYEYDVFLKKDDGIYTGKINCPNLGKLLLEADDRHYIVAKDTGVIYRWNGSYYEDDGEIELKERIVHYLDEKYTGYRENEIIRYVKNNNLIDRDSFQPPERLINLKNGIYNRETKKLEPHNPNTIFLYEIPIEYKPNAQCPKIMETFEKMFDTEDIPLIKQLLGDLLQPTYKFKKALMLVGPTGTGKSQFTNIIENFIGRSNISHVSLSELCQNKFAASELYGKLANICADIDKTKLNETRVFLMATGGDTLRAEKKFQDAFQFMNHAKLIFCCNVIPESENKDNAYYTRWLVIPCTNQIPKEEQIPNFYKTICTDEEMSGLLNLALRGLEELEEHGYSEHRSITEIKEIMEAGKNPIQEFCRECVEYAEGEEITKKDFYNHYVKFCHNKEYHTKTNSVYSRNVKQYLPTGYDEGQSGTIKGRPKVWRNIRCKCEFDDKKTKRLDSEVETEADRK